MLVEREKGLMVATQPIVEHQISTEKKWVEVAVLRSAEANINREINAIIRSISAGAPTERKKFIRKCTKEECKGFLSSQWKCGLCETFTCSDCHELIGFDREVEHVCDKDTLATAKLLDSDTKACPQCATGIFKIEGCDQMFCTGCNTAFSWKTGRIETGQIHNPHYFEYQRNGGVVPRNPLEVRCGREIDNNFVNLCDIRIRRFPGLISLKLTMDSLRNMMHLRFVEIPRYQGNGLAENQDLRIQYMRNRINEEDFKRKLQLRERKIQKKHEFYNILTMFLTCQTEIFYRLLHECDEEIKINFSLPTGRTVRDSNNNRIVTEDCMVTTKCSTNVKQIYHESKTLLLYTNRCLESICVLYTKGKAAIIELSPTLELKTVR